VTGLQATSWLLALPAFAIGAIPMPAVMLSVGYIRSHGICCRRFHVRLSLLLRLVAAQQPAKCQLFNSSPGQEFQTACAVLCVAAKSVAQLPKGS
jgi:hypothetical protein